MSRAIKPGLIVGFLIGVLIGSEYWGGNSTGGSIMAIMGGIVFAPIGAIGAVMLYAVLNSKGGDKDGPQMAGCSS